MKKKKLYNKSYTIIVGLCLIVILGFAFTSKTTNYIKINENYISRDEIEFTVNQVKASVISSVQSKYSLEYDDNFWDAKIGENTPRNILQEKTIELIIRNKMQEELLAEKNLLQYEDFNMFNDMWKKANKERESKLKKNEVIYGPKNYSQFDYYNYLMANSIIKLKESYLSSGDVLINDSILKEFEKENPNLISHDPDTLKATFLSARFAENNGVINQDKKKSYKKILDEAYKMLKEGQALEDIVGGYPDILVIEEQTFGVETLRTDLMTHGDLIDELRKLEENKYTKVVEANGTYTIAFLDERIMNKQRDFDEYKDFLVLRYLDEYFEEEVKKKINSAKVEVLKAFI